MQVVLSVTVMLVDLLVVIMHVTVSVEIIQLKVSAALMLVTISASNMWVTIFIVFMQVGASMQLCRWYFLQCTTVSLVKCRLLLHFQLTILHSFL